MSITIEILYPDIANLYGDMLNMKYLRQCLPDALFLETLLTDTPAFVSKDVSLIYMGAMTERQQELALDRLSSYKDALTEHIKKGTVFLLTGNAMELFGSYIENEDGSRIDGLALFPVHAKRQMMNRYNSLILGEFKDIKIVGFKNQFSHSYGDNSGQHFYHVIRGAGIHPATNLEGLRRNNFFGTYTLGPFLVLNPLFTKYLLERMGIENPQLAYEDVIMEAYEKRLREFENDKLRFS